MTTQFSLVVAIGKEREIGLKGTMPWHISADLKNFKAITMGGVLLMGRKTYESIGKPLPGRTTLILTRNPEADFGEHPRLHVCKDLDDVFKWAHSSEIKEIFVVGGAQIYELCLPKVDKLYLSYVDYSGPADTFFPELDLSGWSKTSSKSHSSEGSQPAWDFEVWERKR